MNGEWINVEQELPSEDGTYEVTNHPDLEHDWTKRELTGTAYYDGYGFTYLGVYRTPKYWRKYVVIEKKYGKIKKGLIDEK